MAEQKQLNINIAPDKQQGADGVRLGFRTVDAGCAASKRGSTSCRNAGSGEEDSRCIR